MFGQTFEPHDLIVIGLLVVLEGVLSIDNALVLGLLARRLPRHLQSRALTYGLAGAFVFRVIAIAMAGFLLRWELPKLLGGLYLVWVAFKAFFLDTEQRGAEKVTLGEDGLPHLVDVHSGAMLSQQQEAILVERRSHLHINYSHATSTHTREFWFTVAVIELTDIAFAVDSILAAIGTVPGREKLWIVVTGGMLGVVLMRFAAVIFIRLLARFPRFETSAYLLVAVIGAKLTADYFFSSLNFHDPGTTAFWIFWGAMLLSFAFGFIPRPRLVQPEISGEKPH